MDNLITGLIAVVMMVVFLGFYGVKVVSIPLWIIFGGVLVMVVMDFYESVKKGNDLNGN